MRKATLILGFLVVSFAALAQVKDDVKQSDLKGPEYKNYQHWKHKTVPAKVYSATNVKPLQGPAYKNHQAGRNISKENLAVVQIGGNEQQNLKGPDYKNYNHSRPLRKKSR
jgi:hypothetical protein